MGEKYFRFIDKFNFDSYTGKSVADPEGVHGVRSNLPFVPNYFIIMENFEKSRVN